MCPICKTDRYLSPNMNFLINPECYHKICESCVDRIFSLGPTACPYPKCGKILRKNKFKKQVFDDLNIEKEIDIRKRVSAIYNKTEEDFDTLQAYNKYLEEVEDIVFNLSEGINVEETEANLANYEAEHKIEILEKSMKESQKSADLAKYYDAVERLKQEKLRIQKQMETEDIEYQKQQQQDLLDKLTSSASKSEDIIQQSQSNMHKRTSLRRKQLQKITNQLDQQLMNLTPYQKAETPNESVTPFTPFNGDRDLNKHYKLLSISDENNLENETESYHDPFIKSLAKKKEFLGAGWRAQNVFERALEEAFLGLGCIIEKEKVVNT